MWYVLKLNRSLKGKILLHEITESNHNYYVEYLCDGGVEAPYIHHYFKVEIVQQQASDSAKEITEQLIPFFHKTTREYHIAGQEKTNGKGDEEGKNHGSNVGADGYNRGIHNFFPENKIIANKKNNDPKRRITATASGIPKGLKRHPTPE